MTLSELLRVAAFSLVAGEIARELVGDAAWERIKALSFEEKLERLEALRDAP